MKTLVYNYITIEGCIGAGKTSLTQSLADEYNAKLILEQFEENSFLPKFYSDPLRYAFPLELSFLADRFQQMKVHAVTLDVFHPYIISDYHIQKSLIFARKTLQPDEFQLFSKLFHLMVSQLPSPELMVYLYLDIQHLMLNIRKRGRQYEQRITTDYLRTIQESYFEFMKQQKNLRILIIDTNRLDFVAKKDDYEMIRDLINNNYPIGITRIQP
ncbi:MAG TPA: deoxynucleoside kinase [Bacteroidales bacterium]|nr:deoxynucleoside kinase [Bacteroidota bacterium]HPC12877.1 deoxynucleoside kinase [Bacteroidales bacterium]